MTDRQPVEGLKTEKHFSSSILLWMRTDKPRKAGMDHWKGPHSQIIAASPGLDEYRQIHLEETNPGLWPSIAGVETVIPEDRKADGLAEVTFHSVLSPIQGRKQTQLAFADEVNVFRRTLLYAGVPGWSRWSDVETPNQKTGAHALIYLRRRPGVGAIAFRSFISNELTPMLAAIGGLSELRAQAFLPWIEKFWDTPNVAHDNPSGQHYHASVILGFSTKAARTAFFEGEEIAQISAALARRVSAIHAFDVAEVLTFVADGKRRDA